MHVAIIGATGLVGSSLLRKLLANDGIHKITTITRRPLTENSPKLNQLVLAQMNPSHIQALSVKADVYICALGTTLKTAGSRENFRQVDFVYVEAFAKLAQKENARALFVVSALGANSKSIIFYNRIKGEMEKAILSLRIPSIYILRPSLIIGNRVEKRWGESLGITLYRATERFVPTYIRNKLGSKVSDIVNFVESETLSAKSGQHIISNFKG